MHLNEPFFDLNDPFPELNDPNYHLHDPDRNLHRPIPVSTELFLDVARRATGVGGVVSVPAMDNPNFKCGLVVLVGRTERRA